MAQGRSTGATVAAVAADTSAKTVLAASTNAGRRCASIYYDGAAILYLILGDQTPTDALYTAKLGDGYLTYFEVPDSFTGKVAGIWSAATGSALVTEFA